MKKIKKNIFVEYKESSYDSSCVLISLLPNIARKIISDRHENKNFLLFPDDPNEHVINWHQFGIITHTKHVLKALQIEVKSLFAKWNVDNKINSKFIEIIDGKSKLELIEIGIILHDIGKFARNFRNENGKIEHNFYGHEAISEKLIISDDSYINDLLKNILNLTIPQISYIGRIAGLHFELGKSREAAKKSILGYSIAFSNTKECEKSFLDITSEYPGFKEEIGLLFLCDSLGKTDIRIIAESDDDIEKHENHIHQILLERNLNPKLMAAVKQLPVNLAITKRYLQII